MSLLQTGELVLEGQFTWGSNYTFLVRVGEALEGVYKPVRGEQPLWDFPPETLAGREVAAYRVSQALGWELVPATVMRADGPFGPGSLQLRVTHDPELHYFTFEDELRQRLRATAAFDLLVNNADRKGGHILLGEDGHIWLIDHGICFHSEYKLRTVVWDFAGQPIPQDLLAGIRNVHSQLVPDSPLWVELAHYLSTLEMEALRQRAASLLANPVYPQPPQDERYMPWPPV